jgi:hypothetical protein
MAQARQRRNHGEDRMLRPLLLTVILCAMPALADEPKFSDYPAGEAYTGKVAKPILDSEDKRMFRTRINDAAKGDVNFAGRYIVAKWGCGASCVSGAVIDAKSGVVTMIPWAVCCTKWDGDGERIQHQADSRLIAFVGLLNEEEPDAFHYFDFERGEFRPVAVETVKQPN